MQWRATQLSRSNVVCQRQLPPSAVRAICKTTALLSQGALFDKHSTLSYQYYRPLRSGPAIFANYDRVTPFTRHPSRRRHIKCILQKHSVSTLDPVIASFLPCSKIPNSIFTILSRFPFMSAKKNTFQRQQKQHVYMQASIHTMTMILVSNGNGMNGIQMCVHVCKCVFVYWLSKY